MSRILTKEEVNDYNNEKINSSPKLYFVTTVIDEDEVINYCYYEYPKTMNDLEMGYKNKPKNVVMTEGRGRIEIINKYSKYLNI